MSTKETKTTQASIPAGTGDEANETSKILQELIDIIYQNRVRWIYIQAANLTIHYQKPNGKEDQFEVYNVFGPGMESDLTAKKRLAWICHESRASLKLVSYKGEAWVQGTKKDRFSVNKQDIEAILAAVRKAVEEGSDTVETW